MAESGDIAQTYNNIPIAGESRAHLGNVYNTTTINNWPQQSSEGKADTPSLAFPPHKRDILPFNVQIADQEQRNTKLREACRDGQPLLVDLLIKSMVDVDARDEEGRTALSFAAESGNLRAVGLLLEGGASANTASKKKKGKVDYREEAEGQRTPLHWAAYQGHTAVVYTLLAAGAKIESRTAHGRTAVMEASWSDHFETMSVLLDRGADVNAHTYHGQTMLHSAARYGRLDHATKLLSLNANLEAVYAGRWLDRGAEHVRQGAKHQTALHLAVQPQKRPSPDKNAMIELLLNEGAPLSAKDDKGATPLHYMVRVRSKTGLIPFLKYASQEDLAMKNKDGNTALDEAERLNYKEIALVLKVMQALASSASDADDKVLREALIDSVIKTLRDPRCEDTLI